MPEPVGPGYQHQPARLVAQLAHDGGQPQLVEGLDLERDQTENSRGRAALVEGVGAETGQSLQTEGEVKFEVLFEAMLLRVGHDAVGQLLGFGRRHLRQIERYQVAVNANLRR